MEELVTIKILDERLTNFVTKDYLDEVLDKRLDELLKDVRTVIFDAFELQDQKIQAYRKEDQKLYADLMEEHGLMQRKHEHLVIENSNEHTYIIKRIRELEAAMRK